MMNAKLVAVIAVGLIILMGGAIFLLNKPLSRANLQPGGSTPLPAVEVRSYEGKDLSSINAFRENSIKGPQHINESGYRLTITGLTNRTDISTYSEVLGRYPHYTKLVTLHCVEGWDATILWEGIQVRDLIRNAGPDPRANTVIFTAHDGYTTSFPLDYLMNRDILMAYRMNNVSLPVERGYPFQLVAEDKWGYKWVKWIEKIELTADPSYKGYWEKRGYSNTGDLDKNFYSR
jgi:DMSO/TMAO reductase YedYZ molybdopterin-dependent catalytic subunit